METLMDKTKRRMRLLRKKRYINPIIKAKQKEMCRLLAIDIKESKKRKNYEKQKLLQFYQNGN